MSPPAGWIRSIGHVARLTRAGVIFVREGVFADIDPSLLPPSLQTMRPFLKVLAKRGRGPRETTLARAMERLGPSYVKLGQFLATRPDIVGMTTARSLESLRDRMPPFPTATAVAIVETSLGGPITRYFATFGEPVAAASIAQVHPATVAPVSENAQRVAVKIARPGVERRFAKDLSDMMFIARIAEQRSDEAKRLRAVQIVETLARSVKLEMDFRLEAAAAAEYAANSADDDDFRVPSIDWDRTAKHVLTTEWIDGIALSDVPALHAAGVDTRDLARIVIQSFLRHAMRDGFFHADMHQGNLFADVKGRLVAVDFGIMGRLGAKEQRFLAEILFGFITRDYLRVARVHFDAGYVPPNHSVEEFAQAIRAIGEPIHARRADEISMAKLFTLLFEVTSLFDMRTRPELVLLQKTMVVVEGVARDLDPHLDIWKTAEPVVRRWDRRQSRPRRSGQACNGRAQRSAPGGSAYPCFAGPRRVAGRSAGSAHRGGYCDCPLGHARHRGRANTRGAFWSLGAVVACGGGRRVVISVEERDGAMRGQSSPLSGRHILLIVGGGIAAYKSLDLVRRLRERGASVTAVLTAAGRHFVTPLSLSSLTGSKVYEDLFSLTDEAEMGHIQLSRSADIVLVAPATADLIAKQAQGLAGDLASTLLLATDKTPIYAPAMNVRMWNHPATRQNIETLRTWGSIIIGPEDGEMACGEFGPGRLSEPLNIVRALEDALDAGDLPAIIPIAPNGLRPLQGLRVVVTAGPTLEAIDPVRFISNRSSGKQGYAIARAAAAAGAHVHLISGPVNLASPPGIDVEHVETADEMRHGVIGALPADVFVATAAVADWRVETAQADKMKKSGDGPPTLRMIENPDILSEVGHLKSGRPKLVIGFAAETRDIIANAQAKLEKKGCDLIVANDVALGTNVFGSARNTVHIVDRDGSAAWPAMSKDEVGRRLVDLIANRLAKRSP